MMGKMMRLELFVNKLRIGKTVLQLCLNSSKKQSLKQSTPDKDTRNDPRESRDGMSSTMELGFELGSVASIGCLSICILGFLIYLSSTIELGFELGSATTNESPTKKRAKHCR